MTLPCFRPTVEALDDRRVPSAVGVPRLLPTPFHPPPPAYPPAGLAGLESQLNQDPQAQARFLANPGRVLRQAGVRYTITCLTPPRTLRARGLNCEGALPCLGRRRAPEQGRSDILNRTVY
jgi:hypothetical protein